VLWYNLGLHRNPTLILKLWRRWQGWCVCGDVWDAPRNAAIPGTSDGLDDRSTKVADPTNIANDEKCHGCIELGGIHLMA